MSRSPARDLRPVRRLYLKPASLSSLGIASALFSSKSFTSLFVHLAQVFLPFLKFQLPALKLVQVSRTPSEKIRVEAEGEYSDSYDCDVSKLANDDHIPSAAV